MDMMNYRCTFREKSFVMSYLLQEHLKLICQKTINSIFFRKMWEEETCKARLGKRRHERPGGRKGGMQGQAGEEEA